MVLVHEYQERAIGTVRCSGVSVPINEAARGIHCISHSGVTVKHLRINNLEQRYIRPKVMDMVMGEMRQHGQSIDQECLVCGMENAHVLSIGKKSANPSVSVEEVRRFWRWQKCLCCA